MKVFILADALSIHTIRWAEYFRDRGDEVHLASFRKAPIEGVTFHALSTYGLGRAGYLLNIARLRKLGAQLQPDIVHAHYVTSYGFLAAAAGLRPLVVTAWGSDVLVSPKESYLLRWFTRYALGGADAITTVAEHMNGATSALCKGHRDVVAVPFGVDVRRFLPLPKDPNGGGSLRLICTRNFTPIYDVETLVEALHLLAKNGIALQVKMVGDGPSRMELERLVKSHGMEGWIKFMGKVGHDVLPHLLGNSDLFVSPALSDGNNISLNEAMACGCFPIATRIPANEQWLEDGINGYLYPPGDAEALAQAIAKAIGDSDLRLRARHLNRDLVERQGSWDACVAKMDKVYQNAIKSFKG